MATIRRARESDLEQVREIFLASYGEAYAYPQFYDVDMLKRMVFSEHTILLVAVDETTDRVLGTASMVFDVGGYTDLIGEFGRLAVHPDARHRGIGHQLMAARIECVKDRIHVGLVEPRASHPFSQKIAIKHGFAPVGFLPMKLLLKRRESVTLVVRYFQDALTLRRNNPRVVPEVHRLAGAALGSVGLPVDAIVDEQSAPYPPGADFQLEELTTPDYAALLRLERGRIRHREIFGPMALHYGLFKLKARHSNYLLAREGSQVVGAVGFIIDKVEKAVRIFELVSTSDEPIRLLLAELLRRSRETWGVEYMDVDVSAHAPRMQRTLLELGFLPAAYIPAMVFHDVERLDVVKMVRILVPWDLGHLVLVPEIKPLAELVIRQFKSRDVLPRIAQATAAMPLFAGLNAEQANRLAAACTVDRFPAGARIFHEGQRADKVYLLLEGRISIRVGETEKSVGSVHAGECLGEVSLLLSGSRSATAVARTDVEAAVLTHEVLNELIRLRPDIGLIIYRNLAAGISHKLRRSDLRRVD